MVNVETCCIAPRAGFCVMIALRCGGMETPRARRTSRRCSQWFACVDEFVWPAAQRAEGGGGKDGGVPGGCAACAADGRSMVNALTAGLQAPAPLLRPVQGMRCQQDAGAWCHGIWLAASPWSSAREGPGGLLHVHPGAHARPSSCRCHPSSLRCLACGAWCLPVVGPACNEGGRAAAAAGSRCWPRQLHPWMDPPSAQRIQGC